VCEQSGNVTFDGREQRQNVIFYFREHFYNRNRTHLQYKPSTGASNATSPTSAAAAAAMPPLAGIPDSCIFLAIAQQYWELQNPTNGADKIVSFSTDHPVVITMAQWMFVVYDGYQKKDCW
jgi:hypothetical protein